MLLSTLLICRSLLFTPPTNLTRIGAGFGASVEVAEDSGTSDVSIVAAGVAVALSVGAAGGVVFVSGARVFSGGVAASFGFVSSRF